MCLAVYIGTDERIEDRSGRLHIEAAIHEPDSLMRQVVPGIVYFVATREGCGCKFRSRSRKDRAPLAAMVSELARRRPAHVYICWEGEQGKDPVETQHISASRPIELEKIIWQHPGCDRPTLVVIHPEIET
jgi:hypothetical protein